MTGNATPTDFQDILTDLDEGKTHRQLGQLLRRIVTAVEETRLKGELTLKLGVTMEGTMVRVVPTISSKIPTAKAEATIFFAGKGGDLSLDNKRQENLPHVPGRPSNVREFGGGGQ